MKENKVRLYKFEELSEEVQTELIDDRKQREYGDFVYDISWENAKESIQYEYQETYDVEIKRIYFDSYGPGSSTWEREVEIDDEYKLVRKYLELNGSKSIDELEIKYEKLGKVERELTIYYSDNEEEEIEKESKMLDYLEENDPDFKSYRLLLVTGEEDTTEYFYSYIEVEKDNIEREIEEIKEDTLKEIIEEICDTANKYYEDYIESEIAYYAEKYYTEDNDNLLFHENGEEAEGYEFYDIEEIDGLTYGIIEEEDEAV